MSGQSAFGILLKRGQGDTSPGPETFDDIANITNITGPGLSVDTIDVSSHDSENAMEEVVPGFIRSGEVTLDANFVPEDEPDNTHALLVEDMGDKVVRNFKLVFPDAVLEDDRTTWSFSALVTGVSPSAPHDAKLGVAITLKITGAVGFE